MTVCTDSPSMLAITSRASPVIILQFVIVSLAFCCDQLALGPFRIVVLEHPQGVIHLSPDAPQRRVPHLHLAAINVPVVAQHFLLPP